MHRRVASVPAIAAVRGYRFTHPPHVVQPERDVEFENTINGIVTDPNTSVEAKLRLLRAQLPILDAESQRAEVTFRTAQVIVASNVQLFAPWSPVRIFAADYTAIDDDMFMMEMDMIQAWQIYVNVAAKISLVIGAISRIQPPVTFEDWDKYDLPEQPQLPKRDDESSTDSDMYKPHDEEEEEGGEEEEEE
jgi:hypothetical protein